MGTRTQLSEDLANEGRPNGLREAVRTIRTRASTPAEREHWRGLLPELLPRSPERLAPRHESEAEWFLELCKHLAEHRESDEEHQRLVLSLIEVQQDISWSDPLHDAVDALLDTTIDELYASLALQFVRASEPGQALELYERLRDHCFGCDGRIIELAATSPHVTGRRILLDFDESVLESAPGPLLRKLENEGEYGFLLSIIGYGVSDPRAFLRSLACPDRLVEKAVTDAQTNAYALPLWVWETDVLFTRFDLLRAAVAWREIELNADRLLWARIEIHLRETLLANPEHWETFHALEENFPGTLDELIEAARLL